MQHAGGLPRSLAERFARRVVGLQREGASLEEWAVLDRDILMWERSRE